jgi:hypothetical protein
MANNPGNSDEFRASGREKFDLNLRSHLEICHGKQAHADGAEIDTKSIQLGRLGEYLHRGVQQLAFPASPVWFEAPFEDHLSTGKDTVAKQFLRAKITDVQWNVERLFNRYLGLSQSGVYTHKRRCSNAIATAKFPETVGCARTTLPRALKRGRCETPIVNSTVEPSRIRKALERRMPPRLIFSE